MKKKTASEILANGGQCNLILQSVLNLNHIEASAYRILVNDGPLRSAELAELIGKDQSTAYRSLKKLVASGICIKDQVNLKKGGSYYLYKAIPPEQVKIQLRKCTDKWYDATLKAIEGFPYED